MGPAAPQPNRVRLLLRRLWVMWKVGPITAAEYMKLQGLTAAEQHAWLEEQYRAGRRGSHFGA